MTRTITLTGVFLLCLGAIGCGKLNIQKTLDVSKEPSLLVLSATRSTARPRLGR